MEVCSNTVSQYRPAREPHSVRKIASLARSRTPAIAGREKPFEPLAASGIPFSIYGHLDAARDTQWVRVMPIRESAETAPGPIDPLVTLEEMETDARVMMKDSMTRYQSMVLGDGFLYAHNFSTPIPIVPGRHYRLTAAHPDGGALSATVSHPRLAVPRSDGQPGCPLRRRFRSSHIWASWGTHMG